eukprot:TRINITY_DN17690_c1_g1_i3.p3 TRINITY_DN17690_c1_g1~~TRINITY_DN17690_c1_g1_i3.p3  ORF type:complete len:147 (-),score=11.27 TRINITY_DN17690_c1_g1_i3:271-711(-)
MKKFHSQQTGIKRNRQELSGREKGQTQGIRLGEDATPSKPKKIVRRRVVKNLSIKHSVQVVNVSTTEKTGAGYQEGLNCIGNAIQSIAENMDQDEYYKNANTPNSNAENMVMGDIDELARNSESIEDNSQNVEFLWYDIFKNTKLY